MNETCQVDQGIIQKEKKNISPLSWTSGSVKNIQKKIGSKLCIHIYFDMLKEIPFIINIQYGTGWREIFFIIFRLFPCPICVENVTESQTNVNVLLVIFSYFFVIKNKRTHNNNIAIHSGRQFHQHFTSSCFLQKL